MRISTALPAWLITSFAVVTAAMLGALAALMPAGTAVLMAAAAAPGAVVIAAPSGRADVAVVSASGVSTIPGTTFVVDVQVEPNAVEADAAAALVTFSAQYLEVTGVALAGAGDSEIYSAIDNAAGTVYYAVARLGAPWPASTFTLARITFRVKATPPATLTLGLVARTADNPNATDVAAAGVSVFNEARAGTIGFSAPTATPTHTPTRTFTPTRTHTPVPPPTSTPVTISTAVPSSTPVPVAPTAPPTATPVPPAGASGTSGTGAAGTGVAASGGSSGGITAAADGTTSGPSQPAFGTLGRPSVSSVPPGVVPPLPPAVQVGIAPVAPPFEQFYVEHEGLRLLGNTLASHALESGILVQYFEKGRIEEHPNEPNPHWRFQYGLLVDELAAARAEIPVGGDASTLTYAGIFLLSQPDARVAVPEGFTGGVASLPDGAVFVPFSAALRPEPGHVVPAGFWAYVNDERLFPGGWLHDVGLPTTPPVEAVVDKGPEKGRRIMVQAFQRTILTFDPLNPPDYMIERANVGTDYARVFRARFGDESQ